MCPRRSFTPPPLSPASQCPGGDFIRIRDGEMECLNILLIWSVVTSRLERTEGRGKDGDKATERERGGERRREGERKSTQDIKI